MSSPGDVKICDLDKVNVAFLGVPLNGWGEGAAIKIERIDPRFTHKVGMDGVVVRCKKGSRMYKITLTHMQGAEANAFLSTIANLDEDASNGAGVGPFVISDQAQGTSMFFAGHAWIETDPSVEYANEAKDREWTIIAADGKNFVGGN